MDANVINWVYSVGASAAGAVLLIGVAGYLGRAQLSHWLNKDLEAVKAAHQSDLEKAKARFISELEKDKAASQRELEAYKVSLIASAEKIRAVQDLQKTMAIKVAEKKIDAIGGLQMTMFELQPSSTFQGMLNHVLQSHGNGLEALQRPLFEVAQKYRKAVVPAVPFLSRDDARTFVAHLTHLHDFLNKLQELDRNEIPAFQLAWWTRAVELEKKCEDVIDEFHRKTMAM